MLLSEYVVHDRSPPILPPQPGVPAVHGVFLAKPREVALEASRQFSRLDEQTVLGTDLDVVLLELGHQQRTRHVERHETGARTTHHIPELR